MPSSHFWLEHSYDQAKQDYEGVLTQEVDFPPKFGPVMRRISGRPNHGRSFGKMSYTQRCSPTDDDLLYLQEFLFTNVRSR